MSSVIRNKNESEALESVQSSKFPFDCPLKFTDNVIQRLKRENFNLKLKMYLMEQKLGYANSSLLPIPTCDYEREVIETFEENKNLKIELAEKEAVLESAIEVIEFREMELAANPIKTRSSHGRSNVSTLRRQNKLLRKKLRKKSMKIQQLTASALSTHPAPNDSLQNQITKMQAQIDKQQRIIDEQNTLMKSLNVRNLTFGLICLLILTRKL